MATPNYNFTEINPDGKIDIANGVNTPLGEIDAALKTVDDKFSTVAPTKHAVDADTYGLGNESVFGHVKIADTGDQTASESVAASPAMVTSSVTDSYNRVINYAPFNPAQINMMPYGQLLTDKAQSICSDHGSYLYAMCTPNDTDAFCLALNSDTNTIVKKQMPGIFSHPNDCTYVDENTILVCDRTVPGNSYSYSIFRYNYATNTGENTGFTQQNIYCCAYDPETQTLYGIIAFPNQATSLKVVEINMENWTIKRQSEDILFHSTIGIATCEYYNGILYVTLHSSNPQAVLMIDAETFKPIKTINIPVRFEIEGCAFHDGSIMLSFLVMGGTSIMRTDAVAGTVISSNGVTNDFYTSYDPNKWKGDGSETLPLITVNPICLLPQPYITITVNGVGRGELNLDNHTMAINGGTDSDTDTSYIYCVARNSQVDYGRITISSHDTYDYAIYLDKCSCTIANSCKVNITKSLFNLDHNSQLNTAASFSMNYGTASKATYSIFNGSTSNTGKFNYTRTFFNGVYGTGSDPS